MRAVVQRVQQGSVSINGNCINSIGTGLVILLGVGRDDSAVDARYLAEKIVNLRIFSDSEEKMNLSVLDICGEVLVISQFTLFGDCRKGRRPGFSDAANSALAQELYEVFVSNLSQMGLLVKTGVFQAHMIVNIENDGPVTMLLDSKKVF